ncbi:MAG: adenylosuccinate synthase [Methylobacterium frigidaeris]
MALRAKSAAETKAAELAAALIRIADREGAPLHVGVEQLRRASPRFTPLAIGQMFRRHRDDLEAALAERGYTLVDYADGGPGRGMEFEIGVA